MGKYTAELTGIDVLRITAAQKLKNDQVIKKRIWSDFYEAWGFFDSSITECDEFLLWCSIKEGDRIILGDSSDIKNFYIVVNIERDQKIRESPLLIFKLFSNDTSIIDVKIKEKKLFQQAISFF